MQSHGVNNFIICIMMLISMISLAGVGIEECRQLMRFETREGDSIYVSESQLVPDDNVSHIQIVEKSNILLGGVELRGGRSAFSYRCALSFLCALAFLSGLFVLAYSQRFVLRSSRYVQKAGYVIAYIESTDGRKRFS